ncbi:MAG: LysR family transcriptional regulator [Alphaproteobacteria bacterium]
MNWDDLRVFRSVAEARTLSAAARRLGISVATVGRRIAALEESLRVRLVDRAPSGVSLTPTGRILFERAAAAADAMDGVDRLAAALNATDWVGPVRVSATEPFISDLLAPALPGLLSEEPGLRIDLVSSTELVSLSAREAEIAVRLARPVGDSLVARRLPSLAMGLFASRQYLGARRPAAIDLRRERLLSYDTSYGRIPEVAWLEEAGLSTAVSVRSSSTRALLNATSAGAGVALLPSRLARSRPELVEIPAPRPIPSRPVWVLTHRDLRRVRPLHVVRDWIVRTLEDAAKTK